MTQVDLGFCENEQDVRKAIRVEMPVFHESTLKSVRNDAQNLIFFYRDFGANNPIAFSLSRKGSTPASGCGTPLSGDVFILKYKAETFFSCTLEDIDILIAGRPFFSDVHKKEIVIQDIPTTDDVVAPQLQPKEPNQLVEEPKETVVENKNFVVEPMEIVEEPKEPQQIVEEPKEPSQHVEGPKEITVEPMEIVVEPMEIIEEPKQLVVEPMEIVTENKEPAEEEDKKIVVDLNDDGFVIKNGVKTQVVSPSILKKVFGNNIQDTKRSLCTDRKTLDFLNEEVVEEIKEPEKMVEMEPIVKKQKTRRSKKAAREEPTENQPALRRSARLQTKKK